MDLSFGLKSKRALEIHHYTSVQQGKIKTTCKRTWNGKELEARERKVLHRQGIIRQGSKLLSHISHYTSIFIQSSPFFYVWLQEVFNPSTHTHSHGKVTVNSKGKGVSWATVLRGSMKLNQYPYPPHPILRLPCPPLWKFPIPSEAARGWGMNIFWNNTIGNFNTYTY